MYCYRAGHAKTGLGQLLHQPDNTIRYLLQAQSLFVTWEGLQLAIHRLQMEPLACNEQVVGLRVTLYTDMALWLAVGGAMLAAKVPSRLMPSQHSGELSVIWEGDPWIQQVAMASSDRSSGLCGCLEPKKKKAWFARQP